MTSQQSGGLKPTRRTLVKGAAWSVPVVAVGSGAPAVAASPPCLEIVFGDATCKIPNEGVYNLQYCFTHNCAGGELTITVVRVRSQNGAYDIVVNETFVLAPGETACVTFEDVVATNMGNFQEIYYMVDGGEVQMRQLAAPPFRDCPGDEPTEAATNEDTTVQEDTTVVEPTPATEGSVETQSTDQAETTAGPNG